MLDAVNITQATNGVNLSALRSAAALQKQPQVEKSSAQPVKTQTQNAVPQAVIVEQKPISPRFLSDSVSGAVVTEFVSSDGEVTQQIPSQAALAYLRAGLTVTGENEPSAVEIFIKDGENQSKVSLNTQTLVA